MPDKKYYQSLSLSKDLNLPSWGPYSKKYFGLSHVADREKGHRMDFFVVPQIYRHNNLGIPDVLRNSNYLPVEAASDLKSYTCRQQLEWKDKIYCDITYQEVEKDLYRVKSRFVNNTGRELNFALHYFLHFSPNPAAHSFGGEGKNEEETTFLSGIDYDSIEVKAPTEFCPNLAWDGRVWCQQNDFEACKGAALGMGFGRTKGDKAVFTLPLPLQDPSSKLFLRYKLPADKVILIVNKQYQITLNDTGNDYSSLPLPALKSDKITLEVLEESSPGTQLFLDGFHSGNYQRKLEDVTGAKGSMTKEEKENILFYSHADLPEVYGLAWDRKESICRSYAVEDFHKLLSYRSGIYDPGSDFSRPSGNDRYYGVCLQPLTVRKNGFLELEALVSAGNTPDAIKKYFRKNPLSAPAAPHPIPREKKTKEKNPYAFTSKTLKAVTLTNIVYPIRLKKEWIKHHTPGRMWDSLYTWDSAFIGMGLLEMDPVRTIENLNTYLNPPSEFNAFVHHGSFVPAHILLFHECANKLFGQEKEEYLEYFFERVFYYYSFFVGHDPKSETASFSNIGLLRSWKYGYNSGGWDDYPPQWYIHIHKAHHILPAVTTSFAVLCAKVLLPYAIKLGKKEIAGLLQKDVERFSGALQTLWDEESGFFSYALHSEEGKYLSFFRTETGENYNKGLDGVMPLVAGCVTKEQEKRLWKTLLDPERFFTPCGISCVDMKAPYFKADGYANGTPWMATEYYLWKRALAEGKGNIAWKIASNTLKNYDRELRHFRQCFEHFSVITSRGNGWHHFSSFSTPILAWCAAYYNEALHLAGGFELTVNSLKDHLAEIVLSGEKGSFQTVLLTGKKDDSPISYRGEKVKWKRRTPFAVEITLPSGTSGYLSF